MLREPPAKGQPPTFRGLDSGGDRQVKQTFLSVESIDFPYLICHFSFATFTRAGSSEMKNDH
jgi:hypothetical protein